MNSSSSTPFLPAVGKDRQQLHSAVRQPTPGKLPELGLGTTSATQEVISLRKPSQQVVAGAAGLAKVTGDSGSGSGSGGGRISPKKLRVRFELPPICAADGADTTAGAAAVTGEDDEASQSPSSVSVVHSPDAALDRVRFSGVGGYRMSKENTHRRKGASPYLGSATAAAIAFGRAAAGLRGGSCSQIGSERRLIRCDSNCSAESDDSTVTIISSIKGPVVGKPRVERSLALQTRQPASPLRTAGPWRT
ncbi:hypothetical protein PLESTB_000757600 [Pleodorina starrii]|uniref:Uncharacterized protein n=1 Tax=Pleodorina starrii TaxID=330485 RepID=A0A9W6BL22_9CHLO|nr:hypothetical protein PLESTB_000757600 [Pleodorina starrii]